MIDAILDPANIIMVLAGVGSFLTVIVLGGPLLAREGLSSRLKQIAKRREELQHAAAKKFQPKASSLRQQQGRTIYKTVVEKFQLLNPANSDLIKLKLARAGFRGQAPLYTYAFFRLAAPIICFVVAMAYVFLIADLAYPVFFKFLIGAGGGLVGFLLPSIVLSNIIQKRQQKITKVFPDALDLMVICVEAGLSMDAAFSRASEEMQHSGPELAEEFALTTAELAFLPNRRQALENFNARVDLPAVKALVTSLAQSEIYGTPLSVSLRVLSGDQRDDRMSRAEKKAASLPAQLTVPMILFFLPVLFIVLLGPAVIKAMASLG